MMKAKLKRIEPAIDQSDLSEGARLIECLAYAKTKEYQKKIELIQKAAEASFINSYCENPTGYFYLPKDSTKKRKSEAYMVRAKKIIASVEFIKNLRIYEAK